MQRVEQQAGSESERRLRGMREVGGQSWMRSGSYIPSNIAGYEYDDDAVDPLPQDPRYDGIVNLCNSKIPIGWKT